MTTTLYRVFDERGWLLYVGISDGIFLRLGAHAGSNTWARHARTITLERFADRDEAEAAEWRAIGDEDPVYNWSGPPGRPERCSRWMLAYPDRHADDVTDAEMRELTRVVNAWATRELVRTRYGPGNPGADTEPDTDVRRPPPSRKARRERS